MDSFSFVFARQLSEIVFAKLSENEHLVKINAFTQITVNTFTQITV